MEGVEEGDKKCCCAIKQYYSKDVNLVDSLDICPRVILCKRPLIPHEIYEQTISIKNTGMYPRSIKSYTDAPEDTELKICSLFKYQYLQPTEKFIIIVRVKPTSKESVQRSRNVFLECEHPSLKIQIPIIAIERDVEIYLPQCIELPQTIPNSLTYYDFVIFNATNNLGGITIRIKNTNLRYQTESCKIKPKDFVRILLKLYIPDKNKTLGSMKIRFGTLNYIVQYCHRPKSVSIYLSTKHVQFEETKFEREGTKQFTICNESDAPIPYRLKIIAEMPHFKKQPSVILRESQLKANLSQDSFLNEGNEEPTPDETEMPQTVEDIMKNYTISPQEGELSPNTSTKFSITFHPRFEALEYNDNITPPYKSNFELKVDGDEDFGEDTYMIIESLISGPEMFITPKAIDFRKVYLGEEHCEQLRITNIDGTVTTSVKFNDYSSPETAVAFITPTEGLVLEPCETGVFNFSFFTVVVGKIYFRLRFKVKNGEYLVVIVKANSVPVRVKTFPDIIEFGTIPFAVPQKRTVLLMNPLSVPISMQCFMDDNGSETPLVLNVDDVKELPPVTIANPVENILAAHHEDKISAYHMSDATTTRQSLPDGFSDRYNSVSEDDISTQCSDVFQNEVMDLIPDMALDVLNAVKAKRFSEKNEPEAKIISQVTDELINLPYFYELRRYNNYARMDWNIIPSDPIEVYYDSEIINLRPNASRSFTVLIIPNAVGYFNRAINIRCCPHVGQTDCESVQKHPFEMIVESQLMVTKIWFEYNCRIPDIAWQNEILIDDKIVYAMQKYDVDMEFKNVSNVGGFLHFAVVPYCRDGVMRFRDNIWKYYIAADEVKVAKAEVEFRKIGNVTLSGMVKIVGSGMGLPFHISAYVIPPRITVFPKEIIRRQNVLETTFNYVYIHNLTPTKTRVRIYMRTENHQTIDPHGAQLAPNGQGTYVALRTMFPDPEVYKNTLYIDLLFGRVVEIPLIFNVVGMPIFFDPDITKGLDIGVILLSTETDYESRKTNVSVDIRVWNMGDRPYVVTFSKLKVSKNETAHHCIANIIKAQILIEPKSIHLNPEDEKFFSVSAVSCQEVIMHNEFRCNIIDQVNPKRMWSKSFTISATFTQAELIWDRKEVRMVYNRTHIFKQKQQIEIVELINDSGVAIENVCLKALGPFKIKALYERRFEKEVELNMLAGERREITILLDEHKLRHTSFSLMKGKIQCYANLKWQRSLPLRVEIFYPDIIIVDSDIVIFNANDENSTEVILENVGLLDAEFKWKKLGECIRYVAVDDDYERYARDILSDIVRMLELHEEDERDADSLCKRNASLCYQKYRCKLAALEDPDGIVNIIYDIINNLDLENKRYKVYFSDDMLEDLESSEANEATSKSYVKETFEQLLEKLKLEESYEISEASEDECAQKEHFYFYEKCGMVMPNHGAYSLLHLPAVKKGYAHMASFILDVVGGQPQRLFVTLVNLDKIVEICPKSIFLGVRPWYEVFKCNIAVYNVSPFKASIHVKDAARQRVVHRRPFYLSDGYACIQGSRIFCLNPYIAHRIKTEGVLGFDSEFIREFSLVINDYSTSSFRLRGQGVLPILLAVCNNLPRTEQESCEIVEEYRLLQRIYYFNMFREITYVDDELEPPVPEEHGYKEITFSQISLLSAPEKCDPKTTVLGQRVMRNWEKLLSTYVIVYNNASLPHATILEQLLNMEKFIDDLNHCSAKRGLLQRLHQEYLKFKCKYDPEVPINLKYFTVQPIPFEQWGYIIEMNNLKLNQFRKYHIDLQFFGPGKLTAAARTAVKIPGLYVHFQIKSHSGQEFAFYRAEEKMPDFYVRRYKNMWERLIDLEINPKIMQAHSYDCVDNCRCHKRKVSNITYKDRKDIKNYYNSLNKSIYEENKHHFINCMIYSKTQENYTGTTLRINIVIKPDSKYYSRCQAIDDFLYIDLHMGPTLPILLRGIVK